MSPRHVDEVRIGYFGPHDPADPDGGDAWRAAEMAVEEANRQGGYRGLPFRLVPGWSKDPWGSGVARVVRMAYADRVRAIIGGIDGPSTHLAEQVVAKARLPLVSPATTDKSVNLANVPWMFSCLPGDHRLAPPLAEEISGRIGAGPFVFISADDHDSHLFAVELRKCFAERRMVPCFHFECRSSGDEVDALVARISESPPAAVVLAAGARLSARLVAALREHGFAGLVFGGPWMGRNRFLEEAGTAAEGVVFPVLYDPQESAPDFAGAFRARFGKAPDYVAAQTYDATRLIVAAVRKAGTDRAQIRDALRELSPWPGATGTVQWDTSGSNTRAVRIGTMRNGRVKTFPRKP